MAGVLRKLRNETVEVDTLISANNSFITSAAKQSYDQAYAIVNPTDIVHKAYVDMQATNGILKLDIVGTDSRLAPFATGYIFTYNTAAYTALGIKEVAAIKFIYNGAAQGVNESYTYNSDGSVKTIIFDFGQTFADNTKIKIRFLNF